MSDIAIIASWYAETRRVRDLGLLWRRALAHYEPDARVILIDNDGPIPPPKSEMDALGWTFVIRPSVQLLTHGRGTHAHLHNSWTAMCYGFQELSNLGIPYGVYVEQDVIVGTPFLAACQAELQNADVLFNRGCMEPGWAYTEYLAGRTDLSIWKRPFPPESEQPLSEAFLPRWVHDAGLREGVFPYFRHLRDQPLLETDTITHHCTDEEIEDFVRRRHL